MVIYSFNFNVNFRPTPDDINLLKKEIIQVQQITDSIVREKENENKQLLREFNNLKLEFEKLLFE